jgi:glycosyltransferase involved in cell wall biosynthesis
VDIIHNNSLWMMPNIYPGMAVRNTACKLITAPRGTMTEYSMRRSSWKKSIMMLLGQKATLRRTDLFHATSEAEAGDIRRLGWRQPVAIVPNGITIPTFDMVDVVEQRGNAPRILLYLSRLHPEKRIDNLLKAWRDIEPQFADWDLWICGPLDGPYAQAMVDMSRDLQLKRARFRGEVLGAAKTSVYCVADLFVLPTNTENFGMVVAEALACGTPAIVTKGAPWSGLAGNRCGWWIENGVDALRASLIHAMSLPKDELHTMGQRGRQWMKRDYSWDMQAENMRCAYEWLLHGGKKPDFVSLA